MHKCEQGPRSRWRSSSSVGQSGGSRRCYFLLYHSHQFSTSTLRYGSGCSTSCHKLWYYLIVKCHCQQKSVCWTLTFFSHKLVIDFFLLEHTKQLPGLLSWTKNILTFFYFQPVSWCLLLELTLRRSLLPILITRICSLNNEAITHTLNNNYHTLGYLNFLR